LQLQGNGAGKAAGEMSFRINCLSGFLVIGMGMVGWGMGMGMGILTGVVNRGGMRTLLGVEVFVHATRPDHAAGAEIQGLAAAQDT